MGCGRGRDVGGLSLKRHSLPAYQRACVSVCVRLCVGVSMLDAVLNYPNVEHNTAYACFRFLACLLAALPEHWAI